MKLMLMMMTDDKSFYDEGCYRFEKKVVLVWRAMYLTNRLDSRATDFKPHTSTFQAPTSIQTLESQYYSIVSFLKLLACLNRVDLAFLYFVEAYCEIENWMMWLLSRASIRV